MHHLEAENLRVRAVRSASARGSSRVVPLRRPRMRPPEETKDYVGSTRFAVVGDDLQLALAIVFVAHDPGKEPVIHVVSRATGWTTSTRTAAKLRPMSDEVTFRDFAAAIMQNDVDGAAKTLQPLLSLDASAAESAAKHFQTQMAEQGQGFMMKAMGLRTAVTEGSDTEVAQLLGDLFGMTDDSANAGVTALRAKYPSGAKE